MRPPAQALVRGGNENRPLQLGAQVNRCCCYGAGHDSGAGITIKAKQLFWARKDWS